MTARLHWDRRSLVVGGFCVVIFALVVWCGFWGGLVGGKMGVGFGCAVGWANKKDIGRWGVMELLAACKLRREEEVICLTNQFQGLLYFRPPDPTSHSSTSL